MLCFLVTSALRFTLLHNCRRIKRAVVLAGRNEDCEQKCLCNSSFQNGHSGILSEAQVTPTNKTQENLTK